MNTSLKRIRNFISDNFKAVILMVILSAVITLINYKSVGFKDSAMIFIATLSLLIEIYLIGKDKKLSVLLFILTFPIMVTSRKICGTETSLFKYNYESIYITILFIADFFPIKSNVKYLVNNYKSIKRLFTYILVFVIFAVNSCTFSGSFVMSLGEVFISVIIPIMFMLCAIEVFGKEDLKKIEYMLICGITFSCLYGFLQIFTDRIPLSKISRNRELLTFGYHNVNIFAGILMCIMPFLIEKILYEKKSKKESIVLCLIFLICIAGLLLTFTRGAWLTFIVVFFLMLISKKYRKVIIAFLALFVACAKPLISFILRRGTSTSILNNQSAIARMQSIFNSLYMMFLYPFGIGAGNYEGMYRKNLIDSYYFIPENIRQQINVANYSLENAHNLWLQIGVDFGIICMIVFLIIFINRIKASAKVFSSKKGLTVSLIVYILFSVTTGIEFNHKGVITETLIIWLVFAMTIITEKSCEV